MKPALTASLLIALGALAPGCQIPSRQVHDGVEVIVSNDHSHGRYCGHYRYGMRWFYVHQHKHGVNCGHVLDEEQQVWMVEEQD